MIWEHSGKYQSLALGWDSIPYDLSSVSESPQYCAFLLAEMECLTRKKVISLALSPLESLVFF